MPTANSNLISHVKKKILDEINLSQSVGPYFKVLPLGQLFDNNAGRAI